MRTLRICAGLVVCLCALLATPTQAGAGIVTFDDVVLTQSYAGIGWDALGGSYAGMQWTNSTDRWEVVRLDSAFQSYYQTSLTAQSGNQAVYNGGLTGWAATLSVGSGSFFTFNGVYFASWPNSNPPGASEVTLRGFSGATQVWAITGSIGSAGWQYFDGAGTAAVDSLVVTGSADRPWLMDSLNVSVPDGGATLALLGGALVALGALRSRLRR
jgi:hypothetical protein